MNRTWWIFAWGSLVLVLVVAGTLALLWYAIPLEGATITFDGETFSLAHLSGGEVAALWGVAVVATITALAIAVTLIVLGVVASVLTTAVGAAGALAVVAIVLSPFLLLGWLVWRAIRGRARSSATTTVAAA